MITKEDHSRSPMGRRAFGRKKEEKKNAQGVNKQSQGLCYL